MMVNPARSADRDFAIGLALGYQWADMGSDVAARERFIDAAVVHCLANNPEDSGDRPQTANFLAASIMGVRCDDDAAIAFWSMVAPGVEIGELSHWFFEGFIYGAAESLTESGDDEFAELRKMIPHPPAPR